MEKQVKVDVENKEQTSTVNNNLKTFSRRARILIVLAAIVVFALMMFINLKGEYLKYAEIGEGVVVTPRSNINANAVVGNFVSVLGSGIGHDAVVGDFSTLSGRCSINGHVNIGKLVYVACGVSIAPAKKIGDGATVGIGSVVISNIKPGVTVFGNPAKKIEI